MLLHTDAFTYRPFYTQTLLHTDPFTHRSFYTQTLLHTDAFTHRNFYTQKLLHTETFTHRSFYTQTLSHTETGPVKSQFYFSFWRSTSISRVRVARDTSKPQFASVFDVQRPFRAKGLRWTPQNRNFPQFLTSNVHFVRKGCDGLTKIAILSQFLTSNVRFVRKGSVSWRSGGTAPALRER